MIPEYDDIQFQVTPTDTPYVGGEFRSPLCPISFVVHAAVWRRSLWIRGRSTFDQWTIVPSQIVAREREEWTEAAVAEQLAAMGVRAHPDVIQEILSNVGTAVPGMIIDVTGVAVQDVLVDDYDEAVDSATRESLETAAYRASVIPASRSAIEGLERVGTTGCSELQSQQCSICMESLIEQERQQGDDHDETLVLNTSVTITRLPCSHQYHTGCIAHWLEINHVCPLCRFEMPIGET